MGWRLLVAFALCLGSVASVHADTENLQPLPLPKRIRIESSNPRGKIWNKLTPTQKHFVYYLKEATKSGVDLLFYQGHRHGIAIRDMIATSLSAKNLGATKKLLGPKPFAEYLIYAAKFMDAYGPYATSNRKYILAQVTPKQVDTLFQRYTPTMKAEDRQEAVQLLTGPKYEVRLYPDDPNGTGLELTGSNRYEKGITGPEVKSVLDKSLKVDLNCRVVRSNSGLKCEVQTTKSFGFVGEKLRNIVRNLEKAKEYAATTEQKTEIDQMILFFNEGNVEAFRNASIAWVRDRAQSPVDFMLGWVEVYGDWLARIGAWESYIQIVDPEVSKQAAALAMSAQYFENLMPYGKFKKTFPPKYSPPAIMVYYFEEASNFRSSGYNLPNFDDIRRDVGAKNVIKLPMPGETDEPDFKAMWKEVLTEFMPASKVKLALEKREKVWRVVVLLHEIIGHGSGTYDVEKYGKNEDPISALGTLGSALEEQRADLTAIVFGGDPKLVEVGVYKTKEEAKQTLEMMYDFYIFDFLRRTSGQRSFSEPHQRGHWLFINRLLEKKAIKWVTRDGKPVTTPEQGVLAVADYAKFAEVAKDLLAELQSIKSNREEGKLRALFEKSAPLDAIDTPWAQAIIERGSNLLINAGYVEQPWSITKDSKYHAYGGRTLESIAPYWK